jgi:RND family efflux transporter MFP subunit
MSKRSAVAGRFRIPFAGARPNERVLAVLFMTVLVSLGPGCAREGSADGSAADSSAAAAGAAGDTLAADTTSTDGKPKKKAKAIKVDTAEVRRGDLVVSIHADGVIRTPRFVEMRTQVGGEVIEVLARDGDRVRAGQLLARIDPRNYALSLEESRYRYYQALSRIAAEADTLAGNREALDDFTRRRSVLEKSRRDGAMGREEYQAALLESEIDALRKGAFRREVLEQRTGLAEARVAGERAKLNLENAEIRAPFAGVVQGLTAVPGEVISAGYVLCSIYNNENLEAVVNVLETDLGNLVKGRPVLLIVPATSDTLHAAVSVISPSLDEASRTCEVLIRFGNPEGRLRPGMFVRAEIAGWIHPDRLVVPRAALLQRDKRPMLFKHVEDFAQWLYVDTGLENEDWIEILAVHSGGSLEPGDRVVVSDHLTLAHEAKIQVRKTLPPEDRWAFTGTSSESAR